MLTSNATKNLLACIRAVISPLSITVLWSILLTMAAPPALAASILDCPCSNAEPAPNAQEVRKAKLADTHKLVLTGFDAHNAYYDWHDNDDVSLIVDDNVVYQGLNDVYLSHNLDVIAKKGDGEENGKAGVIDAAGNLIIPFIYDNLYAYQDAFIIEQDGLYGLINRQNQPLTATEYYFDEFVLDEVTNWQQGQSARLLIGYKKTAALTGKWGGLDSTGQVIIPFEYDEITQMRHYVQSNTNFEGNRLYKVKKDDYWGVINAAGDTILPPEYQRIDWFNADNGLFLVIKHNQQYVIDKLQKVIIAGDIEDVRFVDTNTQKTLSVYDDEVHDGTFRPVIIHKNNKYQLYDSNADLLMPVEYDKADLLYESELLHVQKDGLHGVINPKNARYTIPMVYQSLHRVDIANHPNAFDTEPNNQDDELYFIAQKDDKYGVINSHNDSIFPFNYQSIEQDVYDYPNRLILSKITGVKPNPQQLKYALFAINNTPLTPFIYDKITYDSSDHRLHIWVDGKEGVLDPDGDVLLAPIYDRLTFDFMQDGYVFKRSGKYGWIDESKFREVIPAIYDAPFEFDDSGADGKPFDEPVAKVKQDGNTFWINKRGEVIDTIAIPNLINAPNTNTPKN